VHVYVWHGASKMTVILEAPFATYTLPPDDGLLMPEKLRCILFNKLRINIVSSW
jgi:hypothetical protein